MIPGPAKIIHIDKPPARLSPSNVRLVDQYEWFQLTIGRFLTPVVQENGQSGTSYILFGEPTIDEARLTEELNSFAGAIERLREHLDDLVDEDLPYARALVSLQALLELRLPNPEWKGAFHLRDGFLLFTSWGLNEGVRMADLLGPQAKSEELEQYLTEIRNQILTDIDPSKLEQPLELEPNEDDAPLPDVSRISSPKKKGIFSRILRKR